VVVAALDAKLKSLHRHLLLAGDLIKWYYVEATLTGMLLDFPGNLPCGRLQHLTGLNIAPFARRHGCRSSGVARDHVFSKDSSFAKIVSDTGETQYKEDDLGLTATALQVGSDIRRHGIDPCCVYPASKQQTAGWPGGGVFVAHFPNHQWKFSRLATCCCRVNAQTRSTPRGGSATAANSWGKALGRSTTGSRRNELPAT